MTPFFAEQRKNFSKGALGANMTKFEEGGCAKKRAILWSKFSKKCLKTHFLACFFKKYACDAENFPQNRVLILFW